MTEEQREKYTRAMLDALQEQTQTQWSIKEALALLHEQVMSGDYESWSIEFTESVVPGILKQLAGLVEEEPEPPRQDVEPVRERVDPNGKLANQIVALTKPELLGKDIELDVSGANEGREVVTRVLLTSDDLGGVSLPQTSREMMGAVTSLWLAGNRSVTVPQIARQMGYRKPSKRKLSEVEHIIEACRRLYIEVDATDELRGRGLPDGDSVTGAKIEAYAVEARKIEIKTANGRVVSGYQLLAPPIIYQHAALTKQIVTTSNRLMDVGEGSDTDTNVVIRNRLLTRIARMRNGGLTKMRVRYIPDPKHPDRKSLFEVAGVNLSDRDAKARAANYVISCLQDWCEMGFITGFKEVRGGRGNARIAVDITL